MGLFRPATALSILLFAAFALLLLSTLSTPIIEQISIAKYGGVQFGVFGYCRSGWGCSSVQFGYNIDDVIKDEQDSAFSLPSNARNSLTNLLIVHPIAALLCLIQFSLSLIAHFHGPAHSPKYLLAVLIFSLPTFLVTLLAFLVDILIFVPHLQWGGWIVLASTVLVALSGIATCGVRRQVVGRIARSKRIAENAEVNGQTHFAVQAATIPEPIDPNKIPQYATFEVNQGGPQPEGENIPLNPRRTVSPPVDENGFTRANTLRSEGSARSEYGPPPRGNGPLGPGSNPMGGDGIPMRPQYSHTTHTSSSSGGAAPLGPPPPHMRGPPPAGAYGPPDRRGSGPGPGAYGPPPPNGYGPGPGPQGGYRGGPAPPGAFDPRMRPRQPPGGFGQPPMGAMRGPGPGYGNGYGPPPRGPHPTRGPPMGPMGGMGPPMAMGAVRGPPPPQRQYDQVPQYEDLPANIDNTVTGDERREFEQTLAPVDSVAIGVARSDDGVMDPESPDNINPINNPSGRVDNVAHDMTSGGLETVDEGPHEGQNPRFHGGQQQDNVAYVPPRQQWGAEPASGRSRPASMAGSIKSATKIASDGYYEDVAPEFDSQPPIPPLPPTSPHPPALTPGASGGSHGAWAPPPMPGNMNNDRPRSPTMSITSGFTSISQRPINPRWQEEQAGRMGPGPGPGRGRSAPRASIPLAGNPDFDFNAVRGGGGRGRGRGGVLPR